MKKTFAMTLLTIAFAATSQAALLPKIPGGGYVLDVACGNMNRSIELCVARANQSGNTYVALKDGLRRQALYIPVTVTVLNPGMLGVSRQLLSGTYTKMTEALGSQLPAENLIEVTTEKVVYPNAPLKVVVKINGQQQGPMFELKDVVHAQ